MVVTEIHSPQARQRAAGVHREPVVSAQKQPLPRSAGNRRHPTGTGRSLNDEPGDDARIIVNVELSAPDPTTQCLDDVVKEPWPGGRPVRAVSLQNQPLVRRDRNGQHCRPAVLNEDGDQAVIRISGSDTHQLHQWHVPTLREAVTPVPGTRNRCTLTFVDTRPGLVNAYWACAHPLSAQSVDSATQQNRVQIRDELGQFPSRLLTGTARPRAARSHRLIDRVRLPLS